MISFDENTCHDLQNSETREWLETNGLGGFASSTVAGMNTRRYHGLLVAAVRPPTERVLLLAKMDETVVVNGTRFELGTNRYQGSTIHPRGYLLQTGFRLDPYPIFTYRAGQLSIEKAVFMVAGENTTVIRYRLSGTDDVSIALEMRPLLAFRDYHSLRTENDSLKWPVTVFPGSLRILQNHSTEAQLFISYSPAATVQLDSAWYRQFEYKQEEDRGFDYHEDLFSPAMLQFNLKGSESTVDIIVSTGQRDASEAEPLEQDERRRRKQLPDHTTNSDDYVQTLRAAASQFVVRRGPNLRTIIAGYHWFTDWGRDTMISLPGISFALEDFDTAREILLAFAGNISQGLLPNRFPDLGAAPEYNTADATLWFFHAIGELLRRTNDLQFVREHLYDHLKDIIAWHERGTFYGIRVAEDGLLHEGELGVQLTWMDAKVGDFVVTPRTGKPVELQALWYNAVRTMEEISGRLGDEPARSHCRSLGEGMRATFNGLFWNEPGRCLFDYIDANGKPDSAVRPNQIFAISLPHQLVTGERARQILKVVEKELLTPFGLRTLSPKHPDYRGHYEGNAFSRDTAYHQGTAWPWLLGPFITAYLKCHKRSPESLNAARGFLKSFRAHILEAGLGQISEIFDGDPPHTPRGCIAQAWSVAELLRCELEELR